MKDEGIDSALIHEFNSKSPISKKFRSFRNLFKTYLDKLNVAYLDTCCPSNPEQLPLSFNKTENKLFYFDDESLSTVEIDVVSDTKTYNDVNDILTHDNPTISTIFIEGERGGQFISYSGLNDADNGMIFIDANDNKWIRVVKDSVINVKWYGASESNLDNFSYIEAARDYIYNNPEFSTLYIPQGVYSISDTLYFNKGIKIIGDGVVGYPSTELIFPAGKTGFVFSYTELEGGFGAEMENISFTGLKEGSYDTSKHAIIIRTKVKFNNIIINEFDGNGFHVSACGTSPNGDNNNFGIADHSIFNDVAAYFCTNGFFTEGCDAHIMNLTNCNFSQNRRWGYFGNGLSGDYFENCHFAFNGVAVPGADSVVTYLTKYYVAKSGYDGYFGDSGENLNKQPNTNPDYWLEVSPTMIATAWDNLKRYYSGGPACVRNVNAWTKFNNCYTEASQPPIILNSRSKVDGGVNGAGVVSGSFWNVLYGEQHLYNSGLLIDKYAHIGTTTYDAAAQLKVYNDYDLTSTRVGVKTEGSTADIHNEIKNTSTTLSYGLSTTDYQLLIGGALKAVVNTNGLDLTGDRLRIRTTKTPSSASDTGNAGEICWDTDYIYVCTATNTWKRVAISTW